MASASGQASVVVALLIVAGALYGLTRVATGFIPIEDQGYLVVAVQLPDGASLERTQKVMDQVAEIAKKTPGVDQFVTVAGLSPLDNTASLANAGVVLHHAQALERTRQGQDLLVAVRRHEPGDAAGRGRRVCWSCRRRRFRASAMRPAPRCRSNCATARSTSASCRDLPTRWWRRAPARPRSSA